MKNTLAFITGATAGIGLETARALAAQGASLILNGRRLERLQDLQQELQKQFPQQQFYLAPFDVKNLQEIQDYCSREQSLLQRVSILINNAGLAKGVEKVQEGSLADWETMIDTNIKGLFYMTRFILPLMLKKNEGHIVNLGSVAGRFTYPGGAVYCATKFAVRAFTEGLRMDILGSSVRVSNIEPGMVETEFSLVRLGDQQKADQVYQGMTPLKARDIAETILWCLNRPPHVNIQELVIYPTDQAHVGQVARR